MTRTAFLAWMLTALSACSDAPGPSDTDTGGPPGTYQPGSAAYVSSPIGGKTYVSMMTGTDPQGREVTLRNRQSGVDVTTSMLDGGFDPVAVEAGVGDTLSISVTRKTGSSYTGFSVVPRVSQPKVVRTSPSRNTINAQLDSSVRVVFSQPMDSLSLPGGLHLQHQGLDVPGAVVGESNSGVVLVGRFIAVDSLEPSTNYDILVSAAARSLGGLGITRFLVTFTTVWAPPTLVSFRLYPTAVQLATVTPINGVHMRVLAFDKHDRELETDGLLSFASDNPDVAAIDSDGHVTSIAPGTAVLRSTLTVGTITMTDSVVATVAAPDPTATTNLDLTGVYDFTGSTTDFDASWGGSSTGNTQTAELALKQQAGTEQLEGSYDNFLYLALGAGAWVLPSGSIRGSVTVAGHVTLELTGEGEQSSIVSAEGIVMSKHLILGRYGIGLTSGIFVLQRP